MHCAPSHIPSQKNKVTSGGGQMDSQGANLLSQSLALILGVQHRRNTSDWSSLLNHAVLCGKEDHQEYYSNTFMAFQSIHKYT